MGKRNHRRDVSEQHEGNGLVEQAAEAWARLCIYHVRQKKELDNQNKKAYEYNAE